MTVSLNALLRTGRGRRQRALRSLVPEINALEPSIGSLSDEALRSKTTEFRERLANARPHADADVATQMLAEVFAVVREASRRVLGLRHHDEQLMGGTALYLGWVAEMRTGEGKTLAATLPSYLHALAGCGVHVLTVNDYLARRDAEHVGQVHRWLGLDVGLVSPTQSDLAAKKAAYRCAITYGTPTEFGFDYLRDNLAPAASSQVQRGHHYALVDEADSVLVDEARTPLIISAPSLDDLETYRLLASVVAPMQRDVHYDVDEESRTVWPTELGVAAAEAALGIDNLYDGSSAGYPHFLRAALRAKELYRRDRDYVVVDGQVRVVDESTGRVLAGRRWAEGLHQAVEAKERVAVQPEDRTMATVTLQSYFRLYSRLAGMTGTAAAEADELERVYGLHVVAIPTHRPMVRQDEPDLVFRTDAEKMAAVVDDILDRHSTGQPVLVGTASVERSEQLARVLSGRGVRCRVLNAKQHDLEAQVVAEAGRLGAVTVATNMAGRGTDIILGGPPPASPTGASDRSRAACEDEAARVRAVGGLCVLGTERHSSRRVDDQLRGRAGRQGDPGQSRFYLSLDDDLLRLFAGGATTWVVLQTLPGGVPLDGRTVAKAVERAQRLVEARDAQVRQRLLDYDEALDTQRRLLYQLRQQVLDAIDVSDVSTAAMTRVLRRAVTHFMPGGGEGAGANISRLQVWAAAEIGVGPPIHSIEGATGEEIVAMWIRGFWWPDHAASTDGIRSAMVAALDGHWQDLLWEAECLRDGIELRRMGQQDPLTEWRREIHDSFSAMMERADHDLARWLAPSTSAGSVSYPRPGRAPTTSGGEPCWCGSGRSYPACHGRPSRRAQPPTKKT